MKRTGMSDGVSVRNVRTKPNCQQSNVFATNETLMFYDTLSSFALGRDCLFRSASNKRLDRDADNELSRFISDEMCMCVCADSKNRSGRANGYALKSIISDELAYCQRPNEGMNQPNARAKYNIFGKLHLHYGRRCARTLQFIWCVARPLVGLVQLRLTQSIRRGGRFNWQPTAVFIGESASFQMP